MPTDSELLAWLLQAGACNEKRGEGVVVGDRLRAKLSFRHWTAPAEARAMLEAEFLREEKNRYLQE